MKQDSYSNCPLCDNKYKILKVLYHLTKHFGYCIIKQLRSSEHSKSVYYISLTTRFGLFWLSSGGYK